jgi:hypothetical protein
VETASQQSQHEKTFRWRCDGDATAFTVVLHGSGHWFARMEYDLNAAPVQTQAPSDPGSLMHPIAPSYVDPRLPNLIEMTEDTLLENRALNGDLEAARLLGSREAMLDCTTNLEHGVRGAEVQAAYESARSSIVPLNME